MPSPSLPSAPRHTCSPRWRSSSEVGGGAGTERVKPCKHPAGTAGPCRDKSQSANTVAAAALRAWRWRGTALLLRCFNPKLTFHTFFAAAQCQCHFLIHITALELHRGKEFHTVDRRNRLTLDDPHEQFYFSDAVLILVHNRHSLE